AEHAGLAPTFRRPSPAGVVVGAGAPDLAQHAVHEREQLVDGAESGRLVGGDVFDPALESTGLDIGRFAKLDNERRLRLPTLHPRTTIRRLRRPSHAAGVRFGLSRGKAVPEERRIHFDPFALDLSNECLWRGSEAIKLRPKAFAVLQYLLG